MSIPELRKRNYPEKILLGSLAGSGTLGLLIPPSIILIIYGVTVQESIAKLFIAGQARPTGEAKDHAGAAKEEEATPEHDEHELRFNHHNFRAPLRRRHANSCH